MAHRKWTESAEAIQQRKADIVRGELARRTTAIEAAEQRDALRGPVEYVDPNDSNDPRNYCEPFPAIGTDRQK